jgi:Ca2+-binding EF-hand superfamily protein
MSAAPLVLAALLSVISVSSVFAQARPTEPLRLPAQNGRFADMDSNRDGIIQRNEWRGSWESFRVHDWNRDGVLSGDELRLGRWSNGRWEDVDYDSETSGRFGNWTEESFTALDHNRDGRISPNEWHYDTASFYRVDRNRDNVISRAEFLGDSTWDDDRDDVFQDLDLNNNNRIERNEWHGSAETFQWLDRNGNGSLSHDEVVGNERQARNAQFNSLDYDRNGRLSRDEWHWSRASFESRDRNRDGVLTRQEFDAVGDVARTRNNAQNIRVEPRERWTDTGVTVTPGDMVNLNATGTILMVQGDPNDIATPAGSRTGRRAENALFPNQPAGALVGRIGNGAPFFIGNRGSFRAPTGGRLYLGVNDDHLLDNSGEFMVDVNVIAR